MTLASPLVQVPAIISSIGASFVIASWLFCKRWRSKVEAGKLILLVIGCTDFVAAANYFNAEAKDTRAGCLTQAIIMQAFEISSWNYNAVLAYEIYFLVISSTAVLLKDTNRLYRHLTYHLIVVGFAIASVATALANGVMGAAGDWCWLTDSTYRIGFGYVPLWIGFAIIIACNGSVVRMAVTSNLDREKQRTRSGDRKSRLLFRAGVMRLLIVPFAFILLHLPGTFRRIMEAAAYDGNWYVWMGNLQAVCDPSQGTMTALLYAGFDRELRKEWWLVLQGRAQEFIGDTSTHSNTNVSGVDDLANDPTKGPRQDSYNTDRATSGDRAKRNSMEARLSSFVGSIFRSTFFSADQTPSADASAIDRFNEYVDVEDEIDDAGRYTMQRDSSL